MYTQLVPLRLVLQLDRSSPSPTVRETERVPRHYGSYIPTSRAISKGAEHGYHPTANHHSLLYCPIMADDVLSMLPSQVQRRHANDWTNYEAMLPRPSHSKAGLHDECVRTTVPFVRTILRASAHEKTTTSARQNNHDKFLASPRKPSWRSAHEERDVLKREWKAKHSVLSEEELAEAEALEDKGNKEEASKLPKRPKAVSRTPRPRFTDKTGEVVSTRPVVSEPGTTVRHETPPMGSYSETHAHLAKQSRTRAPGVTEDMQKQRYVVTSGRAFTWGGRLRFEMPKHDPTRSRQLLTRNLA